MTLITAHPSLRRQLSLSRHNQAVRLLSASICMFLLAACQTPPPAMSQRNMLPHPLALAQKSETVSIAADGSPATITETIERLGSKNLRVDMHIGANVPSAQINRVRQQLQQTGISDALLRRLPGTAQQFDLVFSKQRAIAQGCPAKNAGSWDNNQPLSIGFGCTVNSNLAAQIVTPSQIARPETLGAPNAITAVGAVEAYQRGDVAPIRPQAFTPGKAKE